MVSRGLGTVPENPTLSIPVSNPKPLASFNEGGAISVPYRVALPVAVDAEAVYQEVHHAVLLVVVLTAPSACVMEPLTILGKVGAAFIIPMAIVLTFGALPRLLSHFMHLTFLPVI